MIYFISRRKSLGRWEVGIGGCTELPRTEAFYFVRLRLISYGIPYLLALTRGLDFCGIPKKNPSSWIFGNFEMAKFPQKFRLKSCISR